MDLNLENKLICWCNNYINNKETLTYVRAQVEWWRGRGHRQGQETLWDVYVLMGVYWTCFGLWGSFMCLVWKHHEATEWRTWRISEKSEESLTLLTKCSSDTGRSPTETRGSASCSAAPATIKHLPHSQTKRQRWTVWFLNLVLENLGGQNLSNICDISRRSHFDLSPWARQDRTWGGGGSGTKH